MRNEKLTRVVITGMGVVAPNAVGLTDFETALREGKSGLSFRPEMAEANFGCQVAGVPPVTEEQLLAHFSELTLKHLKSTGVMYGTMAGMEAWKDAGFEFPSEDSEPDWDSGCVFGTGMTGAEIVRHGALLVDAGKVKRLGSRSVEQGMGSGPSAFLGGRLGLGNRVSSNSAACATGTEAILMAAERIRSGKAKRMMAGSCDSQGIYVWGGFDAMRVLNRRHNDQPTQASRPLSETAKGFIPGAGSGALLLESLESAQARGARIYAELLGGHVNSGGQLQGGSMTAPNPAGVKRCIQYGLAEAGVSSEEIDLVSGHLTATMGDPLEVANWVEVLGRKGENFPYMNSLKGLIGHCLSAAGAIETIAAVLQLKGGFVHTSANSEDLHPEVEALVHRDRIPLQAIEAPIRTVAKASFGFGDVNACLVLRKWEE